MATRNNYKIDHIVLLRAIAIILVVLAHATYITNPHMYNPIITPWWEVLIRNYIYSFHMPLFFWISGYVFFYSSFEKNRVISLSNQLFDKVKRLIIPMYSVSFLVLLPTRILFGHINGTLLHQVKLLLSGNNNDHLWFLKCLFIIFVLVIPLKNVIKTNNINVLLSILIIWVLSYSLHLPVLGDAIKFFPFFFLGFLTRKHKHSFDKLNFLSCFLGIGLLHMLIFALKENLPNGLIEPTWYLVAFLGTYFIYFLARYIVYLVKLSVAWMIVKIIDESSYSIYLFHFTFLYLILYVMHLLDIQSPIIRITLFFLTGMLFPVIFHYIISKYSISAYLFGIKSHNNTFHRPR